MLKIDELKKSFIVEKGEVRAVQDVSIDIADGQFFTLLGPSGSGKSTTLRCIAGLEQPEDGEIYIGGQCVFSAKRQIAVPPEERPIGMVFQSYAIWPHMDVFHNVAFPLLYGNRGKKKLSKSEIEKYVTDALTMVQMEGLASRPATQLSGGQQQRVALARALATSPGLLLLDEPLSALDARVRLRLRHEIKALQRRLGVTTIMVTHDQEEALTMADRIVVMNHGAIEQVGTPQEIYRRPATAFVADFVGSMNFLSGTLLAPDKVKVAGLTFDCTAQDGLSPGAKVALCIRPEDVRVRDLPADITNRVAVEVAELDFVGAFCRATLKVQGTEDVAMTADFSSNLIRDLGVELGRKLDVALPSDRLRVFAA
jgi:iron(III) transport system ATP-binding protein